MKIKIPKKINSIKDVFSINDIVKNNDNKKLISFFKKIDQEEILKESFKDLKLNDIRISGVPHIPDLCDLYIIYNLIEQNNRINILEYGCGWSSLVILKALHDIKKKKKSRAYARLQNPYSLTIVDAEKKFLNLTKKKLKKSKYYENNVIFNFSKVEMRMYKGRYSSQYINHPRINPDFIYLDGPSQWIIKNSINNFTINHQEMTPMAHDIISYEYFLLPGTIILVDGRTNNVNFLKLNFKRNWKLIKLSWADMSIFYLDEKPLGPLNKEQLKFYK